MSQVLDKNLVQTVMRYAMGTSRHHQFAAHEPILFEKHPLTGEPATGPFWEFHGSPGETSSIDSFIRGILQDIAESHYPAKVQFHYVPVKNEDGVTIGCRVFGEAAMAANDSGQIEALHFVGGATNYSGTGKSGLSDVTDFFYFLNRLYGNLNIHSIFHTENGNEIIERMERDYNAAKAIDEAENF